MSKEPGFYIVDEAKTTEELQEDMKQALDEWGFSVGRTDEEATERAISGENKLYRVVIYPLT